MGARAWGALEHQGPRRPLHPRESVVRAPGAAGSEQSFCADLGENSLRILEADKKLVQLHPQGTDYTIKRNHELPACRKGTQTKQCK